MIKGNNVLITYIELNTTLIATFLEEVNGMYLMKNVLGEFAITKKKVLNGIIKLEVIED